MNDYRDRIPKDEEDATRRLDELRKVRSRDLATQETEVLLRWWWAFFWLNPALHPDDVGGGWPKEVKFARPLATEMFKRYLGGRVSDANYYPMVSVEHRLALARRESDGLTRLSWETFEQALSRAGVIVAGDSKAVYAVLEELSGNARVELREYNSDDAYCVLAASDNQEVTATGSSIFVTDCNGVEEQLTLYRTWVVSDDLDLLDA